MSISFSPVGDSDAAFLIRLYAAARREEMAVVSWTDEQKQMFLQQQFEAQNFYYRAHYSNASFDIVKLNDNPIGRFYLAELADEIRIIDLTFLPEYFDRNVFIKIIKEVLRKGEIFAKPVRIYLESFNPLSEILGALDFQIVGEHGIYFLWQYNNSSAKTGSVLPAVNLAAV